MDKNTLTDITVSMALVVILLATLLIPMVDFANEKIGEDDDYYVFMITGQSNSAYRHADLTVTNEEVKQIPYDTAFYLGTSERPPASNPTGWESEIDNWQLYSMNEEDGTWHIGNYEAELASVFYHATGKKCLIINAGWDSASIEASQPGEYQNTYFKAMFERGTSLIPSKYDVKLGCIFWSQGEADDEGDMTVDEYKEKFLTMWEDYQEDMGWGSILMAQTRFDQSAITPVAQTQLNGIDHIYLATTITQTFSVDNGLLKSDNQHYSQKGRILVADDWMDFYLEHEYTGTSQPEYGSSVTPLLYAAPVLVIVGLIITAIRLMGFRKE